MECSTSVQEILNIQPRFLRSTQIERDFYDPACLNGYVVTPHICDSLARINDGLGAQSGLRSWRITGDYGVGKSSFALLLTHLYARREDELHPQLRQALAEPIEAIKQSGLKFHPVLVSGSREPLSIALLLALKKTLIQLDYTKSTALADQIDTALKHPKELTDRLTLELLAKFQDEVANNATQTGLLIVLDELGKFLEFAALHPERQDIFFLQQLAEMAARSAAAGGPLFVIGLLHQGFSAYSELLSQSTQREWEKVAGRFEELLFNQPLEQISYLLAEALSIKKDKLPHESGISAEVAMREALGLHWYGATAPKTTLQELAPKLYPLHPTLLPVLVNAFRRWGQNESSLFSFLLSSEPRGLQEFCVTATCSSFYRISNLYDYIAENFGHRLSTQSYRSHWNHIDSLVRSFPSSDEVELAILKTVAFLNLLDTPTLLPAAEAIVLAVAGNDICSAERVRNTLDQLHRERHVLYLRGNQGAYCLWSHTSVNLEVAYEDAGRVVTSYRHVSQWIKEHVQSRPLIARRHYIQTGTFRIFDIKYCDINEFLRQASSLSNDSDGLILLPLCETLEDVKKAESIARSIRGYQTLLIGIPEPLAALEGLVREVEKWKWIERNTPLLKDDKYAVEEVTRQLALAIKTLENRIDYYVGLQFIIRRNDLPLRWFYEGKERHNIRTGKHLTETVSEICDSVYNSAPKIHNELINRKAISSAATLARSRLIERICKNTNEPLLGLKEGKKPPEMAIYLSLLKAGNVHVQDTSGWRIILPSQEEDVCCLRPALLAIDSILQSSGGMAVSIPSLMDRLRGAPFGVRDGMLPLLLALYIQMNLHRTALYEDGTYLPNIGSFDFIRLAKEPEHFAMQYCAIEGVRAEVFDCLVKGLGLKKSVDSNPDILEVVRPLVVFVANLPDYSRKTQELSTAAIKVRAALLEARDPVTLVFSALPNACGLPIFNEDLHGKEHNRIQIAQKFASILKEALNELRNSYSQLLKRLELAVIDSFDSNATFETIRADLLSRATCISSRIKDPTLRPFIFRLMDDGLQPGQWLESLGSLLTKKPPERWVDKDEVEFYHQLSVYVARFFRVEAVVFRANEDNNVFHLVMTHPNGTEKQEIFRYTDLPENTALLEKQLRMLMAQYGKQCIGVMAKMVWDDLKESGLPGEHSDG